MPSLEQNKHKTPGPLMIELLLAGIFVAAVVAAVFACLAYSAARKGKAPLNRLDAMELLRTEGDVIRAASGDHARALRQEIGSLIAQGHSASVAAITQTADRLHEIGERLAAGFERMAQNAAAQGETLRTSVEGKLAHAAVAQGEAGRDLREELSGGFQRLRQGVNETLHAASEQQKERLDGTQRAIDALGEKHALAGEQLRRTVEGRLDLLRTENAAELEKVRQTVDEKLNTTLNKRLDESFGRVVEQLNKAYEAFGEMRNISAHVGDLKNVLTNPKLRGTFGEVQLAMLLQDFLSPGQYIKDAQCKEGSSERVEYAIRLPMGNGEEMLLPVDAKFPREDHERMIQAMEAGDPVLTEHFRKQLENRIKSFAKDICKKYINPPRTTERAILFLPTESLFAEVLRQPGLFETLHRDCNVMLAGPTTFSAILHAFQINHRSMALAKQSSEVWKVLSAVRTEFGRYNDVVAKLGKQLNTAAGSVEEIGRRTRAMDRTLKGVESLPDDGSAAKVLGLDGARDAEADDLLAALASSEDDVVVPGPGVRAVG